MTTAQITLDWLDALTILRRVIDSHDVRALVEQGNPLYTSHPTHRLLTVGWDLGYKKDIEMNYHVESLPKIERVEAWTYAAAVSWFNLHYPGDQSETPREAFQQLCLRAGCWWKNNPDIRERWRSIDFYIAPHTLPNAIFEDRPVCRLCHGRVATGGGSTQQISAALADLGESGVYRPDLHEECDRYIHRVMIPALKLQREQEKLTATAEVDK